MQIEILEGPLQEKVGEVLDAHKNAVKIEQMYRNTAQVQSLPRQLVWLRSELKFLEAAGLQLSLVSILIAGSNKRLHQGKPASAAIKLAAVRWLLVRAILKQHCEEA